MKTEWVDTKDLLFGIPCVRHSKTRELMIFGRYGEIWAMNNNAAKVLVRSHRIAKRYLPEPSWPIDRFDEIQFEIPLSDLQAWLVRLNANRSAR